MINILYDYQVFSQQKYGGVSRYFLELMSETALLPDITPKLSLLFSDNHYINTSNKFKCYKTPQIFQNRKISPYLNYLNQYYSKYKIKNTHFDVFHPTNYNPYFINYLDNKPFVLTVYDMIHERLQEHFRKDDVTTQRKKHLCNKADQIIAISQSTKNDLVDIFSINPDKITVIHLGNSLVVQKKDPKIEGLPENYILFVGGRGGYKNFKKYFESIIPLLQQNKDLNIVCVGGKQFTKEGLHLFQKAGLKNQIFHFKSDDKNLPFFYKNALLFIFPSLYEGFGIPILESFACDCPLVCSNTSSLPEVAGDAAAYFDPTSEESMYQTTLRLINSEEERKNLTKEGERKIEKLFVEKNCN